MSQGFLLRPSVLFNLFLDLLLSSGQYLSSAERKRGGFSSTLTDASSTSRGPLCSYTDTSLILSLRPKCTRQAYYRVSPDNWLYFPHVPITHTVHVDGACGDSQAPERRKQAGVEPRPHRHTAQGDSHSLSVSARKSKNHEPRRQPEVESGSSRQPCGCEFTAQSSRNLLCLILEDSSRTRSSLGNHLPFQTARLSGQDKWPQRGGMF